MAKTRTVSVISGKGGVGKTTTAVALASYWAASGSDTYFVDADPQDAGGATWWLEQTPPLDTLDFVKCTDSDTLRRIPEIEGYEFVVIDTPPRPETDQMNVIASVSDLIIVMADTEGLALSAAIQTVKNIVEPSGTPYACLVSMVDPRRSGRSAEAQHVLRANGFPAFDTLARHYAVLKSCPTEQVLPAYVTGLNADQVRDDIHELVDEVLEFFAAPKRARKRLTATHA